MDNWYNRCCLDCSSYNIISKIKYRFNHIIFIGFGYNFFAWVLIKSVELPGWLKFEFHELERIELEAKEAGLINNEISEKEYEGYDFEYPHMELAKTNQSLVLVSLRIEIEKTLRLIAKKYKIDALIFYFLFNP